MKKIALSIVMAVSVLAACSAKGKTEADKPAAAPAVSTRADTSYAFGFAIGTSLKQTEVEIDYAAFMNGVKDVMEGKDAKMTPEEANAKIQEAIMVAMAAKAEANKVKEAAFLAENGKKPGVTTTASGLQYEVITQGSGAKPVAEDTVKVDYVGTLVDGTTFDSSVQRGEPAVFPLNQVIPGWTEGIQLMSIGSKYKFYIPAELAYGETGAGDVIPPNSTLIFEVDLLEITPTPAQN